MGHEIVGKFGRSAPPSISALKPADVAIEFTQPELAPKHIALCKAAGIPVVVGTTGWYAHFEDIKQQFHSEGALFTATNFSIGVNITFYINRVLAGIMNRYPEYAAGITEIHHTQKIDAPSGTAISLAEGIIKENLSFDNWELSNEEKQAFGGKIPIHAVRENDVPGTHTISWNSAIDNISITHLAHNRQGFAKGAVLAAEWIIGKQGVYSMEDMLNFESI
jgi:4-hydroxy-tetrahydrodipicolinate reductase